MTGARASIVIPAHNEERVLARLLESWLRDGLAADLEVVIVPNGCTDATASVARRHGCALGARVLELATASKTSALNAADAAAHTFPRCYVDADVDVTPAAVDAVVAALTDAGVHAARPPLHYDATGADALVRAYYRARTRTPELMTQIWGAGFIGISAVARARWGPFPHDVADDLFVASRISPEEFIIVEASPVVVHVPRTSRALVRTLRRVHRRAGGGEVLAPSGASIRALLRANRAGPRTWADALVYVLFSLVARAPRPARARRAASRPGGALWERDESTR